MTKSVTRYYAQYVEMHRLFGVQYAQGWFVFDRDKTDRQGEVLAIAFCASRKVAFRIRDVLNNAEQES